MNLHSSDTAQGSPVAFPPVGKSGLPPVNPFLRALPQLAEAAQQVGITCPFFLAHGGLYVVFLPKAGGGFTLHRVADKHQAARLITGITDGKGACSNG